ncbi:hypothetical protein BKA62DRAFT_510705 [Auriculariales sp. MPI-PUGE-AT-0066]|nr:hypothetical protein BKA62DRAFT_510705 [Auriculariales sp. MPI-PUGE-AT-0066]
MMSSYYWSAWAGVESLFARHLLVECATAAPLQNVPTVTPLRQAQSVRASDRQYCQSGVRSCVRFSICQMTSYNVRSKNDMRHTGHGSSEEVLGIKKIHATMSLFTP